MAKRKTKKIYRPNPKLPQMRWNELNARHRVVFFNTKGVRVKKPRPNQQVYALVYRGRKRVGTLSRRKRIGRKTVTIKPKGATRALKKKIYQYEIQPQKLTRIQRQAFFSVRERVFKSKLIESKTLISFPISKNSMLIDQIPDDVIEMVSSHAVQHGFTLISAGIESGRKAATQPAMYWDEADANNVTAIRSSIAYMIRDALADVGLRASPKIKTRKMSRKFKLITRDEAKAWVGVSQ